MSYNTRRTTGGSAGRGGAGMTQVNYHQQPAGRGAGNAAQQQTRSLGYTTQQGPVSYNSAAQPAYSTPTPQAKPPAAAQPALPAQPSTPVSVVAQPPATPVPVKVEPVTPQPTPSMETQENGEEQSVKPEKVPFWRKRAVLSSKVRKARTNAKLRRALNPKNAVTVLNELKPGKIKFVVQEESGWGYSAKLEIDGKLFTGHGMSVSKAKMHASEIALKDLMLEQLAKAALPKVPTDTKDDTKCEDEQMAEDEQSEEGDGEVKRRRPPPPEDDVPWGSLAAFALHKLFNEWQSDSGESMPMPPEKFPDVPSEEAYYSQRNPEYFPRRYPGPPGGPYSPAGRGRVYGGPPITMPRRPHAFTFLPGTRPVPGPVANPQPMRKIPVDAGQRHPVMLLNQLKTELVYNENREGTAPNIIFAISVNVDGKDFVGRGRNKKEAKKNAAIAALSMLGIKCQDDLK